MSYNDLEGSGCFFPDEKDHKYVNVKPIKMPAYDVAASLARRDELITGGKVAQMKANILDGITLVCGIALVSLVGHKMLAWVIDILPHVRSPW